MHSNKSLILAILVIVATKTVCCVEANFPFENPKLPWDQRVDDLVGRLTLEEIARFSISHYTRTPPDSERLGIHSYRFINECLRGIVGANVTSWPQALGLSATFR